MILRRLGSGEIPGGSEQKMPRRSRAWRYILLTLGAGLISGLLAMAGIWPFSSLQTLAQSLIPQPAAALIEAHSIFPAAQPVHKVVDVYDPPPPAPKQAPPPPASTPSAHPSPSHSPRPPHPTPSGSPRPDD